jgi:hypothetical protein
MAQRSREAESLLLAPGFRSQRATHRNGDVFVVDRILQPQQAVNFSDARQPPP